MIAWLCYLVQLTGTHYPPGILISVEVEDVWNDNYLFFISPLDKKTISNFHSCLSGIPVGKKISLKSTETSSGEKKQKINHQEFV